MTTSNGVDTNRPPETFRAHAKNLFHSKIFKWLVLSLAELLLLIGVFALGVGVASHKARFTDSWMRNYPGNFGGPKMMSGFPMRPDGHFLNAHGVDGTILSKDSGAITIKDEGGNEKTILISSTTTIRQNFNSLKSDDLKVNDHIIVIGSPNEQGQIEAKLIRVLNQ